MFTLLDAEYAPLWIVLIGARAIFSYGADHRFRDQPGSWSAANGIPAAKTDPSPDRTRA